MSSPTSPFTFGFPAPDPITRPQAKLLAGQRQLVMDVLTPEERTSVELMGFDQWLSELDKWEASALIRRIKDQNVVEEIRRQNAAKPQEKKGRWFDTTGE